IQITDVDSYGLPDTPLLGSELTLTATVQLAGLRPDEVVVQAVLGRVDGSDALVDPVTVPMAHTGTADGGNDVFSTTTPLPVAGPVGYTVGSCRITRCWPVTTNSASSRWRECCPQGFDRRRAVRAGGRTGRGDVGHAGAQRLDRPGDERWRRHRVSGRSSRCAP